MPITKVTCIPGIPGINITLPSLPALPTLDPPGFQNGKPIIGSVWEIQIGSKQCYRIVTDLEAIAGDPAIRPGHYTYVNCTQNPRYFGFQDEEGFKKFYKLLSIPTADNVRAEQMMGGLVDKTYSRGPEGETMGPSGLKFL